MMTAQEAVVLFDHQVAAATTEGEVVYGNNRGMASKAGRTCLAIECPDGFRFIPLEQLARVDSVGEKPQ